VKKFDKEDLNCTGEAEVAFNELSPPAPSTFEIKDTDPSVPTYTSYPLSVELNLS